MGSSKKKLSRLEPIRNWFRENARPLPWRSSKRSPYAVWISEIMLQQTRAAVVIPYYHRWMSTFPTVQDLAQASIEEVLKLWEGLGYYSRARALHRGAQIICQKFDGTFPRDPLEIRSLPGIGPYTAGAILSFAYGVPAPALDGNVMRVLTRYLAFEEDIAKESTRRMLEAHLMELLPEQDSMEISEGLIELGATLCSKTKPQCTLCPLNKDCLSYRTGRAEEFPKKSTKVLYTKLYRYVFILQNQEGEVLLQRPGKKGIMADLAEFPYCEEEAPISYLENSSRNKREESTLQRREITPYIQQLFGAEWNWKMCKEISALPPENHSFTRFRVQLYPYYISLKDPDIFVCPTSYHWVSLEKLALHTFSSGHRRILESVADQLKKGDSLGK